MINVKKTGQRAVQVTTPATDPTSLDFTVLDFTAHIANKTRRLSLERLATIRDWSSLEHATWQRYVK